MIIRTEQELVDFTDRFKLQASAMLKYNPVKVEFEVYHKTRSQEQNRYMWSVFQHIVDFYHDTGFMPDNLQSHLKFFNKDVAKMWFCAKYDMKHTSCSNTKEMVNFIDRVQRDMIEQTQGEYEPIIPDDKWGVNE